MSNCNTQEDNAKSESSLSVDVCQRGVCTHGGTQPVLTLLKSDWPPTGPFNLMYVMLTLIRSSSVLVQKQGRFEVYEGDAQPPMSPPVGPGQQFMDQNLGSKPTTPEHGV